MLSIELGDTFYSLFTINSNESRVINFTFKKCDLEPIICLNNKIIENILVQLICLGLVLDYGFTWNDHVNGSAKKLGAGLFVLKSIAKYISMSTAQTVSAVC